MACSPWLSAAHRVPGLLHPDLREELAGYEPGRAIADALEDRHVLDQAQ